MTKRVPLSLKILYTAFVAVLVPVYWHNYGPTNFLYFCDTSLLLTLVGVWTESALLVSMSAVGILAPQALWVTDFVFGLFGGHLTGMTDYMFDEKRSLFLRGLSFFHGWLPFWLVYLVWRFGYDGRALPYWTVLAWTLMFICYFFMPPPSPDAGLTPVNIDYVYGMSDAEPQHWMPQWAWFCMVLVAFPLVLYWPVHLLLTRYAPKPGAVGVDAAPVMARS